MIIFHRFLQLFIVVMLIGCVGCGMKDTKKPQEKPKTQTENKNDNVEVLEKLDKSVTNMKDVKRATAIKMGNTAYVAVMLQEKTGNGKSIDQLKEKIVDKTKATSSSIKRVYVSTNPDLMKQFDDFTKDIQAGKPVKGLTKNLMDTINRIFPQSK